MDSYGHLLRELERIDLLIRARVAHFRKQHTEDEHFRGLYISEQEVDGLLAQPVGRPTWLRASDNEWLTQVDGQLAQGGAEGDPATRLGAVRQLYDLTRLEVDVLLICLASELDLRYEKLFAYLQDDVTRRRPSVELITQLLTATDTARLAARRSLQAGGPLVKHRLVHLLDDPAQPKQPLLARHIKIDDRIVQYLLECDEIDEGLRHGVELATTPANLDMLRLDAVTRELLRRAWPEKDGDKPPILLLRGPHGSGKRSIARALCHERNRPLLMVNGAALLAESAESPARNGMAQAWHNRVELLQREARLRGAAIFWYGIETRQSDAEHSQLAAAWQVLDDGSVPCILATEELLDATAFFPNRGAIAVLLPEATHAERRAQWTALLQDYPLAAEVDLGSIANRFKLTLGQIRRAAATARHVAQAHGGAVAQRDLLEACRLHSNQKLRTLARKIPPHDRWGDIVLPLDRVTQLREICNQVKYRERVYSDWGFGRKLALGKGLAVLFSGPSGTGKTMAAGIIAGELGLDLYKIDLSTVISKYIGETEKNLGRIFDEAETSNAILFFDEADALFGKRSEVRDSHDRYANIEVGFLLQRMEEYEGVAILATNIRKNMDDAFVRRLHFAVEFPFPDVEHRYLIWQGIWPLDTPRADGLDLHLLAERYEMSGGNIKNIALAAAFLAADDGGRVTLKHIVRSIHREYQKAGKLMFENDESTSEHDFV